MLKLIDLFEVRINVMCWSNEKKMYLLFAGISKKMKQKSASARWKM